MVDRKSIQEKIYDTFAEVASSIGYSPLHGKIIGALLVNNREMSLKEIAKETGYSVSMISLSLDLLEILGVIKKIKKTGDRNLYVSLQGDLLECLKNAIIMRVQKSISNTLSEFESAKKQLNALSTSEKQNSLKSIAILENHIKRLEKYVNMLAEIKLP